MAATATTRVYVHNLPWDLTNEELAAHMSGAGTVTYASIMTYRDGRSKGCALVHYATSDEAARAVSTLAETELKGRKILVREDREPEGGPVPGSRPPPTAGGRGTFRGGRGGTRGGGFGGRGGGRGGGFAGAGGPTLDGAGPARPDFVPGTSLYVGNLAWEVNWRDLKDLFGPYGVTYADVKLGPDGRSKGFGIVRFATPADAARATAEVNGFDLKGRNIIVRDDNGPRRTAAE